MSHRRYDYDVLRVCSMLGVVYLHVAAPALRNPGNPVLWNFSNLLTCLFTPAVPLFFMISGALLLENERTTDLNYLFRKRLPRLLIPLAAFSTVTLLYRAIFESPAHALEGLSRLLNTPATVPYWFLYALIPMYLISPFLGLLAGRMAKQHWKYLILLWLTTRTLYTIRVFLSSELELIFTEHWTLNLNFIGGYLGYFLLGAYLERWQILPSRKALAGIITGCLCVSVLGSRWDAVRTGMYPERFTSYLNLLTILLSSAIFLLAKSYFRGRETSGTVLPLLAGNSFAVYLLHPLVIGTGRKLWSVMSGAAEPANPLQQILFYGLVTLSCVCAAVICSSIPGVCYLLTGQSFRTARQASNLQALLARRKS